MDQVLFSVFTPIYNSADTIHRVWESLNNQTYKNFEWIIVDDYSNDNIKEIIKSYKKDASFPILDLYHTENLGKHFAWNLAADKANGDFFVPADADDTFIPETLEKFLEFWNNIPNEDRDNFSGVNVLCKYPHNSEIVGNPFPKSPLISDNLELNYKYKVFGEKWGMIRTDLLKEHKYPEFRTTRGSYKLSYLWFLLAKLNYKVVCYNVALRDYYVSKDSSIIQKNRKNPKKGSAAEYSFLNWNLNNNISYIISTYNFKLLFKGVINLIRNGLLENYSIVRIISDAKNWRVKLLLILFAIPGYLIYRKTYHKYQTLV